jgi:hypothetical protein
MDKNKTEILRGGIRAQIVRRDESNRP